MTKTTIIMIAIIIIVEHVDNLLSGNRTEERIPAEASSELAEALARKNLREVSFCMRCKTKRDASNRTLKVDQHV